MDEAAPCNSLLKSRWVLNKCVLSTVLTVEITAQRNLTQIRAWNEKRVIGVGTVTAIRCSRLLEYYGYSHQGL